MPPTTWLSPANRRADLLAPLSLADNNGTWKKRKAAGLNQALSLPLLFRRLMCVPSILSRPPFSIIRRASQDQNRQISSGPDFTVNSLDR